MSKEALRCKLPIFIRVCSKIFCCTRTVGWQKFVQYVNTYVIPWMLYFGVNCISKSMFQGLSRVVRSVLKHQFEFLVFYVPPSNSITVFVFVVPCLKKMEVRPFCNLVTSFFNLIPSCRFQVMIHLYLQRIDC